VISSGIHGLLRIAGCEDHRGSSCEGSSPPPDRKSWSGASPSAIVCVPRPFGHVSERAFLTSSCQPSPNPTVLPPVVGVSPNRTAPPRALLLHASTIGSFDEFRPASCRIKARGQADRSALPLLGVLQESQTLTLRGRRREGPSSVLTSPPRTRSSLRSRPAEPSTPLTTRLPPISFELPPIAYTIDSRMIQQHEAMIIRTSVHPRLPQRACTRSEIKRRRPMTWANSR